MRAMSLSQNLLSLLLLTTSTMSLTGCASTVNVPIPAPEAASKVPQMKPAPPETPREAIVDTLHGVAVADPYRWLEDIAAPEVKAWVESQDAFTRPLLDAVPGRDALVKRFEQLFYLDSVSAPYHRGDTWFWSRRFKDREKSVVFARTGKDGEEKAILDPNTWSTDGSVSLGGWFPSWDGRHIAYKVNANNADEATLKVRDVMTGEDLPDVIPGAKYAGLAWEPPSKDKASFFYVNLPPVGGDITIDNRPGFAEIRWHRLGTDPATDPVIFANTGSPETFLDVDVSKDGHWVFVTIMHGWNQTDIWFRDLRRPVPAKADAMPAGLDTRARIAWHAAQRGFSPLAVGLDALTYVTAWKDRFYLLTNDGAPRYRVYSADPRRPARAAWRELIPEGEGTIESLQVAGGHLMVSKLVKASSRLELYTLEGRKVRDLPLPGLGSVTAAVGAPDDDEAYFTFTSFTNPPETYKTSISKPSTEVWFKVEVPVDTSRFEVAQVFYPSKDGTSVSMFIVHRKGLVRDASHPTLLYGYGGFNQNMTPTFASSVAVWLELGGVYAMPNLRGGGEYGEAWHRGGMLDKKQNVFDDFIAAGEFLVREGFTTPDRLAIRGGSNGGLLVGAAMTQRPDLFRAVICAVPLLDMVRYHLFGSGRTWIPEYGSSEDPALFPAIHAYSPYHRVVDGTRYPALLMLGADSDDRVDPMHARKFIAAIQHAIAGLDAPHKALFRLERNAGHGGGDLVKQSVQTFADQFAFLASELGIDLVSALGAVSGTATGANP
jgi:prolyl oligopeptidase